MPRIIDGSKNNIIGQKVKIARLMRKMSQKQLADKLETTAVYICRGSISRIESGERTVTDIEIEGLAKVLEVPIEYFFYTNQ
jgi:transcriptional regulator with XRE-family HTH domain